MIELPPAVVRDVDAVDAVLAAMRRVLGGGDALQDQRDVVLVLEALDVVPVKRGLEARARLRAARHGLTKRLAMSRSRRL